MKLESKVKLSNRCKVESLRRRKPFPDSTMQRFNNATRRGFTLVEMILAIGVAAMVLIAVNAVLFSVLRLRNATTNAVDAVSPVDQTVALLRRDLACVVTPTNGTDKVLSGCFQAGAIQITGLADPVAVNMFTADGALSENAPWADIQEVTYGLRNSTNGTDGRALYRTVTRNLLSTAAPVFDSQLLLNGVASVSFSCYDGAQWQPVWDTSDTTSANTNLPLAVRVDIQMAGDSANEPIELVVPIDSVARTNMTLAAASGAGN